MGMSQSRDCHWAPEGVMGTQALLRQLEPCAAEVSWSSSEQVKLLLPPLCKDGCRTQQFVAGCIAEQLYNRASRGAA